MIGTKLIHLRIKNVFSLFKDRTNSVMVKHKRKWTSNCINTDFVSIYSPVSCTTPSKLTPPSIGLSHSVLPYYFNTNVDVYMTIHLSPFKSLNKIPWLKIFIPINNSYCLLQNHLVQTPLSTSKLFLITLRTLSHSTFIPKP